MIRFGCPTCQHVIETPPEQGGTKVRCPKCSQRIRVPTRDDLEKTVPGKLLMGTIAPGTTGLAPGEAVPVKPPVANAAPQTPAPTPPKEPQWYFVIKGKRQGPVTGVQLAQMLGGGSIKATDVVWTEGMPKWEPAQAVAHRFTSATADKPRPGVVPAGLKPMPSVPAATRKPGVPMGLAVSSAGAASVVLAATIGAVVFFGNTPDSATDQTTDTSATPSTSAPDIPLADLTTKSKPSMARIHLAKSKGTGFLVGREYIITNWQPLADAPSGTLQASFPAGPEMTRTPSRADLVHVNPRSDLAILRINTTAASFTLADEFAPTGGEGVGLAGFPDAQDEANTQAVRLAISVNQDNRTWYPLQGTLAPGYAGGPLLNSRGEVVSVACLFHHTGRAVPLADLRKAYTQAQTAAPTEQAARNARHDAAVLYRRLLRSGKMHFEILDKAEGHMQDAIKKGSDPVQALLDEQLRTEAQRKEVKAPVEEGQALLNQLVDNKTLPPKVMQPLIDFNGLHERIRKHLDVYRDVGDFTKQTKALADDFYRLREQLQAEFDLPPLD